MRSSILTAAVIALTALPAFAQTPPAASAAAPPATPTAKPPTLAEILMKGTPQAADNAVLTCHKVTLAVAGEKAVVRPIMFDKADVGSFTEPLTLNIFVGVQAEKVLGNAFTDSTQDCRAGEAPVTALHVQLQATVVDGKAYMAYPLALTGDEKPDVRVATSLGRFAVEWKEVGGETVGFMRLKL